MDSETITTKAPLPPQAKAWGQSPIYHNQQTQRPDKKPDFTC